jgi:hypothetical protein
MPASSWHGSFLTLSKANRIHRNMRVSTKIALAVVLAGAAFVGVQLYKAVNAEEFNKELAQKVERNQLIGKFEGDVIAILGEPSSRVVYRDGDFTLNYFPGVLLPFNKFQAHFRSEGTLRSIELMDD